MNTVRGFICGLFILVVSYTNASGQLYDKLVKECYKVNSVFADTGYLSLTIKYYFSTEKNAAYTDSASAFIKLHKGNYYGKFGSTESVQNKQYLVTVYSDNNSIVVSNPVVKNNLLAATNNLDSSFLANDIDSAWITESGANRNIRFRFTKASGFKSYSITYNKTSYRVQKIVYSLRQGLFNQADTAYLPANPIITIQFSGYTNAAFSDNIFSHGAYVKKDSVGQFKGAGNYSSFEVMSTWQVPDSNKSSGFFKPPFLNSNTLALTGSSRSFLQFDRLCKYCLHNALFAFAHRSFKPKSTLFNKSSTKIKYNEVAV